MLEFVPPTGAAPVVCCCIDTLNRGITSLCPCTAFAVWSLSLPTLTTIAAVSLPRFRWRQTFKGLRVCTSYFYCLYLCNHVKERQYIALFCIFRIFRNFPRPQILRFRGKGLTLHRSLRMCEGFGLCPAPEGCNHSGVFCFLYLQYLYELCNRGYVLDYVCKGRSFLDTCQIF